MKKGLLAKAEKQGRFGDGLLVHMRRDEIPAVQRALGTKGTRNPNTGLLEFWAGEGDTDSGAGPGVATDDSGTAGAGGVASPTEAPDVSITAVDVGPQAPPGVTGEGVTSMGTAPSEGPGVMERVMAALNITPQGLARAGLGLMMGPMSPGLAHMAAQGIGGLAGAMGATNEGAAAAQGVVGMGGPGGDAGQVGGGPGFTEPPGQLPPSIAPQAPKPPVAPPAPPAGGLLSIGPRNLAPYNVMLQYPNLNRGLLG